MSVKGILYEVCEIITHNNLSHKAIYSDIPFVYFIRHVKVNELLSHEVHHFTYYRALHLRFPIRLVQHEFTGNSPEVS